MRTLVVLSAAGATTLVVIRPITLRVPIPGASLLVRSALLGGAGMLIAAAAGMAGPVLVGAAGVVASLPAVRRNRARERQLRLEAARWPDFLVAVRSRLATGANLPAACADAGRHLGGRFLSLAAAPGHSFAEVISRVRAEWSDPLADRVLTTLETANTVGGSQVGVVLGSLGASLNDDLRLRRAHEAALTEQRLTAAVALLAPWVILILSVATNPASAAAFSTPTGERIVAGGLAATVVGYMLARRSARLSRPPRLFG